MEIVENLRKKRNTCNTDIIVGTYKRYTWNILNDIGHKCTEVTANVLQCVRVLVVFSLKQLPGEINILEQCAVQRVALSIQPSTGSV